MPPLKNLLERPKSPTGKPKEFLPTTQPLSSLQPKGDPERGVGYEDGKNLPTDTADPFLNPVLRCALPAINASNSDALRQWYRKGTTQFRILLPK